MFNAVPCRTGRRALVLGACLASIAVPAASMPPAPASPAAASSAGAPLVDDRPDASSTRAPSTVAVPAADATARPAAEPAAIEGSLRRVMNAADRRHLLIRSGIGAAPDDLLALEGMTREEGIAHVVAGLATEPSSPMPDWTREPPPHYHALIDMTSLDRQRFDRARDRELGELRRWWTREMLATPSPQTERLVLFWHDLFATSYHGTHRASLAMARQNATFRRLGGGSWGALLRAMIRDAALLAFLDNDSNVARAPNENLAREFLELFTLGEGHYTQSDVREAARALTGHATSDTRTLAFRLRTWDHDGGDKTLFGVRGPHDGDALVELVLARPAAARHLATRFWQAFVADGTPDPEWLDAVSTRFRASGHDIGTLYRDTLSSEAFWSDAHRGALVRSPVDLAIGTARALDYPKARWQSLARWQADLGMDLFAPPDVAGWREGDAFVTSGALLERERMVARLIEPVLAGEAGGRAPGAVAMEANAMGADAAGTAPLEVRLAAEDYRGAAAWRVSLREDGETSWTDLVRVLENGHDTRRDGPIGGGADKPWQDVAIPAPSDLVSRADAVVVELLNDDAGGDGDRNLHVDGARLDGLWLDASLGEQSGACVPENPLDAGSLYCPGRLVLRRPAPDDARGASPEWRASAVHARWANADEERHVAGIALDDVATPLGDFHRVQFRLVATADARVELEIESFDCVPDCIDVWPECAWRDDRFPAARLLSLPVDGSLADARAPCHLESLGRSAHALVATLARSLPALLDDLAGRPSGAAHRETLAVLAARVVERPDRWSLEDDAAARFVVDAAFAPPEKAPVRLAPPPVRVDVPGRLAAGLDEVGLELRDVLLAGWADEATAAFAARADETALETIRRIVAHPAFQLR